MNDWRERIKRIIGMKFITHQPFDELKGNEVKQVIDWEADQLLSLIREAQAEAWEEGFNHNGHFEDNPYKEKK